MSETILPRGWHLKKELQLGHLITTAVVAVSALGFVNSMEKRITLVERELSILHATDDALSRAQGTSAAAILVRMDRLDDKLDRIIEQRMEPPRTVGPR
jgi:hypothetical protein